jgi:hypothetical protein
MRDADCVFADGAVKFVKSTGRSIPHYFQPGANMVKFDIGRIYRLIAVGSMLICSACSGIAQSKEPAKPSISVGNFDKALSPKEFPAPRPGVSVTNFEECVKAGYPVMRSYPAKCATGTQTFVEKISDPRWVAPSAAPQATVDYGRDFVRSPGDHRGVGNGFCKDQCGDGTCQEIVCQAQGCPCAESHGSCPKDCK